MYLHCLVVSEPLNRFLRIMLCIFASLPLGQLCLRLAGLFNFIPKFQLEFIRIDCQFRDNNPNCVPWYLVYMRKEAFANKYGRTVRLLYPASVVWGWGMRCNKEPTSNQQATNKAMSLHHSWYLPVPKNNLTHSQFMHPLYCVAL
jgi:hypothetical protein